MSFETFTIESKIHDTWAEFKKYLDGTYATLAFTFDESTDFYTITTEPYSNVAQRYELLKDSGSDQTDFETNFKSLPLRISGSKTSIAVYGYDADGDAPTKPPVLIAGFDGTNVQSIRTASDGTIRVDPTGTTTQPISGTVTANAGIGVFNVTPSSPIATDYLPVRLTNGSSFYEANSGSTTTLNASFIAYAQDIQVGNNKSMFSIVNNSGLVVKIRKIYVVNTLTSTTTGTEGKFNVLRISDHSGGTLITPSSYDTNDTLNASITCRTAATVASESSLLVNFKWSTDEWKSGAFDQEGYDHAQQLFNPIYNGESNFLKPITLRNAQGISIKFITNSTNGVFDIVVAFTQE